MILPCPFSHISFWSDLCFVVSVALVYMISFSFPISNTVKLTDPEIENPVSHIAGGFFTISATREAPHWPHSWVIWMIGGYFSQILLCGTVVNIPISQSNLQSPGFLIMWFCL